MTSSPSSGLSVTTKKKLWGLTFLFFGIVFFFCLGNTQIDISDSISVYWISNSFFYLACRYLSFPFYFLFGKAAYIVPFCLIFTGLILLVRFHKQTRSKWVTRFLLSIPILACLVGAIGGISNGNYLYGGKLGWFYFNYLELVIGRTLAIIVGTYLLLTLGSILWGISIKGTYKRLFKYLKPKCIELIKIIKNLAIISSRHMSHVINRLFSLASKNQKEPPLSTIPKSDNNGDLDPIHIPRDDVERGKAPWEIPDDEKGGDDRKHIKKEPFPQPENDEPLDLNIIEPSSILTDKAADLEKQIPELQEKIIDIIKRTTKVKLKPSSKKPKIGMTSIFFNFKKEEGQIVSISNIEKAQKDIGVETRRAPVRINIRGNILIELPLKSHERIYSPIFPLLQETMPKNDGPITYLIGRTQEHHPFELKSEEALHILVGGATGGGKTVLLHTMIFGFIFRYPPSKVRLSLADSKLFEFSRYQGLPHLWQEIATKEDDFFVFVENLSCELDRRKKELNKNEKADFPALITIVDEFSGYDSAKLIRLIAEARALKMYFVLSTQYPVAEVISTSIKANLVTNIAFRTRNKIGSQLIIGYPDATSLLGQGDCFVNSPKGLERIQAGWVTGPSDKKAGSDLERLKIYLRSMDKTR